MPAGERHKTLMQAVELLDWLTGTQIGRRDLVCCLGGGVVIDMGGWTLSTPSKPARRSASTSRPHQTSEWPYPGVLKVHGRSSQRFIGHRESTPSAATRAGCVGRSFTWTVRMWVASSSSMASGSIPATRGATGRSSCRSGADGLAQPKEGGRVVDDVRGVRSTHRTTPASAATAPHARQYGRRAPPTAIGRRRRARGRPSSRSSWAWRHRVLPGGRPGEQVHVRHTQLRRDGAHVHQGRVVRGRPRLVRVERVAVAGERADPQPALSSVALKRPSAALSRASSTGSK